MHSHFKKTANVQKGPQTNGDKFVEPPQRPPPRHPHFAPLIVPLGSNPVHLR
jgi:hypothetical protein